MFRKRAKQMENINKKLKHKTKEVKTYEFNSNE